MARPRVEDGADRLGIWKLAWPSIIANLMYSLVGLVALQVVGSLGAGALAAVTAGQRVFFVVQAFLMAILAGTTALMARAWGAGRHDEVGGVAATSLTIALAISGVGGFCAWLWSDQAAQLLGLEGEARAMAGEYLLILGPFMPLVGIGLVVGTALRAVGDALTPLYLSAFINVLNVPLLYLLVFGGFGVPAMGITGAALAGGLSFSLGALASLGLWCTRRLKFSFAWRHLVDLAVARRILRIGYPAGIESLLFQAGLTAFLLLVARYGTESFAAYGIGVNLLSLSFLVGFGFSIAASTLVARNLGAGEPVRARHSGWRAMRLSMLSMALLGGLVIVLARPFTQLLVEDPEVVRLTVIFIYFLGAMQPMMAVEFALGGALRGAGDTRSPLFITMLGLLVVRLGLALLLYRLGLGVEWIFATLVADYGLKAVLYVLRFRSGRWVGSRV